MNVDNLKALLREIVGVLPHREEGAKLAMLDNVEGIDAKDDNDDVAGEPDTDDAGKTDTPAVTK